MDSVISRIKLNRLYSKPEIFEPIDFYDGINLILGEKSDENTIPGRKTIGVGKTMSIEFINYLLLKDYKKSRIRLIPPNVLSEETSLMLDLEIGNKSLTIIRNVKDNEKVVFLNR